MTWHHVALIMFACALVGIAHSATPSYQAGVLNFATVIVSATLGHAGAQRMARNGHSKDPGNNQQGE